MQLMHLSVHLSTDPNALPFSEEIFLLLKPGHYDILVPRDKSLRLLRLAGLGKVCMLVTIIVYYGVSYIMHCVCVFS